MKAPLTKSRFADARGFSMLEMLIVGAMITIMAGWALMSVASSQNSLRLANASSQLRSFMEKARADSIRRHARNASGSNAAASVQVTSASTYRATLDSNNDGNLETRDVSLPQGVTFTLVAGAPLPSVAFDWRGRTAGNTSLTLRNGTAAPVVVSISGSGDVAANGNFNSTYNVNASAISTDVDVNSTLTPTPTPTPTP